MADVSTKANEVQNLNKEPVYGPRSHQLCGASERKQAGEQPPGLRLCIVPIRADGNCHGKRTAGGCGSKEGLPPLS